MKSNTYTPGEFEKDLIYAIGKVTYLHASGLEEVLSQLLAALDSQIWPEYKNKYEKTFKLGFRKKTSRVRILAEQRAKEGRIEDRLKGEIFRLLDKAECLTNQRNKAVHAIHDSMWEGSDPGASDITNFVLQTDFGFGTKKGEDTQRKLQPQDFLAMADKIWRVTQRIAKIAHSLAPAPESP